MKFRQGNKGWTLWVCGSSVFNTKDLSSFHSYCRESQRLNHGGCRGCLIAHFHSRLEESPSLGPIVEITGGKVLILKECDKWWKFGL